MIRKYKDSDYNELQSWQHARGLNMPAQIYLSNMGFIVPNKAAGFLYTTNSGVCHLEMIMSNPDIDKQDRDIAINKIVELAIFTSQALGYKVITSTTTIDAIVERAKQHGFTVEQNHSLLIKKL